MFKIVLAVIIAIVLMRVFTIVLNLIEIEFKKRWGKLERKSSYREAFILECSSDMLKDNPYAQSLDKAIRKIDSAEKKLASKIEKSNRRLSKMKVGAT